MLLHDYLSRTREAPEEREARLEFQEWFLRSSQPGIEMIADLAWQIFQLQVCFEGFLDDIEGEEEWINKLEVSKKQSKEIQTKKKRNLKNSKEKIKKEIDLLKKGKKE